MTERARAVIDQTPRFAKFLDLSNLGLTSIPEEAYAFNNLQGLYLSDNDLTQIPPDLFSRFPFMTYLDLRNNRIKQLPKTIGGHAGLRTLLLGNNRITRLPVELGDAKGLQGLNLAGNPILFPSDDIIEQGCHSILAYLRANQSAHFIDQAFVTNEIEPISREEVDVAAQNTSPTSDKPPLAEVNPFALDDEEVGEGSFRQSATLTQGSSGFTDNTASDESTPKHHDRDEDEDEDEDGRHERMLSAVAARLVSNVLSHVEDKTFTSATAHEQAGDERS